MFYRLGRFHPRPGSHDFEALHDHPEAAASMLDALEKMLKARLSRTSLEGVSRTRPATMPDLLVELTAGHADRDWVTAVHDRLADLRHRLLIRLLACEYDAGPDGFLCIAATSPMVRREVFPNDWAQAGFVAIRVGDSGVSISPRVFREVCHNGSIVSWGIGDQVAVDATAVGCVLTRCFVTQEFEEVVLRMRETQERPPEDWRDEGHRLAEKYGTKKVAQWFDEAWRRMSVVEKPTSWDQMNALTEVARDLPDWPERADLENAAGRLARLRRPAPRRTPGNVELVPS